MHQSWIDLYRKRKVPACVRQIAGIAVAVGCALGQSTGTFIATGSMTTVRTDHTATLLANGKVLIAGGYAVVAGSQQVWASAEIYDPASGSFTATGSMSVPRTRHTVTLLPDGRVLIAGGYSQIPFSSGNGPIAGTAELYDPDTGVDPFGQTNQSIRAGARW